MSSHVHFRLTSLVVAFLLRLSVGSAVPAVQCEGDRGLNPWLEYIEDMRNSVCEENVCGSQFGQNGRASCSLRMPIGGGWEVIWNMDDLSGAYPTWSVIPSLVLLLRNERSGLLTFD